MIVMVALAAAAAPADQPVDPLAVAEVMVGQKRFAEARRILDVLAAGPAHDHARDNQVQFLLGILAIEDKDCSVWLTLAGSTSAAGCMHVYRDMIRFGMIDCVVATGASIIDMDFFEALGFRHYQAAGPVDDNVLRENYIDRIYDTYIDEEELQTCDHTILEIANRLEPRGYSSREFIWEM